MLSSGLRSEQAVRVNIAIMRAFVTMRGLLSSDDTLSRKLLDLEQKYDRQLEIVLDAIRRLIEAPLTPRGAWGSAPTAHRRMHEIRLLQRVR